MNRAEFDRLSRRVSNWGRWGATDERGTLNLITPDHVTGAAACIRRGAVFNLGIPVDSSGPMSGLYRTNPVHLMSETGARQDFAGPVRYTDDFITMCLQASTQWDALGHVHYDQAFYNGFSADSVSVKGLEHCGIEKVANGVAGRGVLLDIARLRGVDWMEVGEPITPLDLEEAERTQGVRVCDGDIVLIRTGWWAQFLRERDAHTWQSGEPGLTIACAEWLHSRAAAAIGMDNWAIDVLPYEIPELSFALHMLLIRDMGMLLGEIFDLESLALDCSEDGVYEFFFSAPPLLVTGGAGSPINPLAIK